MAYRCASREDCPVPSLNTMHVDVSNPKKYSPVEVAHDKSLAVTVSREDKEPPAIEESHDKPLLVTEKAIKAAKIEVT